MTEGVQQNEPTAPRRRSLLVAAPLIVFAGLAAIFWFRLGSGDPSRIPSALIGHPAPQTRLAALDGLVSAGAPVPGLDPAALKGHVSIVNVWASWCVPCHDEAPLLLTLGKELRAQGVQMIGINQKDAPENARRHLSKMTDSARELIVAMDDLVWAVDPTHDTLDHLGFDARRGPAEQSAGLHQFGDDDPARGLLRQHRAGREDELRVARAGIVPAVSLP